VATRVEGRGEADKEKKQARGYFAEEFGRSRAVDPGEGKGGWGDGEIVNRWVPLLSRVMACKMVGSFKMHFIKRSWTYNI